MGDSWTPSPQTRASEQAGQRAGARVMGWAEDELPSAKVGCVALTSWGSRGAKASRVWGWRWRRERRLPTIPDQRGPREQVETCTCVPGSGGAEVVLAGVVVGPERPFLAESLAGLGLKENKREGQAHPRLAPKPGDMFSLRLTSSKHVLWTQHLQVRGDEKGENPAFKPLLA